MDKINDDAYVRFCTLDEEYDFLYALDDEVPMRVHKIALYIYLKMSKEGHRIPPPLQDYINHGLQRIQDGERTAFKTTRSDTFNHFSAWNEVVVRLHKDGRENAINDVAALFKVTERTIKNQLEKFGEAAPKYVWYYVIDAMVFNKVE